MHNPSDLYQLQSRIIEAGKNPPRQADIIYPFGQRACNQTSVLDAAARFEGQIAIADADDTATYGFPGFTAWEDELLKRRVPIKHIEGYPGAFTRQNGHLRGSTLTECQALIPYMRERDKKTMLALAPYWHLMRCYMTAVGVALVEYPELKIYPALGDALPWDEPAEHSQGTTHGIRADFMFTEAVRLFEYYGKGVPDAEAVLKYMDRLSI